MQIALNEPTVVAPRRTSILWLLLRTNFVLTIRNRATFFWSLIFPAGFLLLFGSINTNAQVNNTIAGSPPYIDYFIPGVVVSSIMSLGIVSNSITLSIYRDRGVLRRIQATPVSPALFLVSRIIVQAFVIVAESSILIAVGIVVFKANYTPAQLIAALPGVLLGGLTFIAVGQMVASFVRKPEAVTIIGQFIFYPLMFLSGILIPLDAMPDWVQRVGQWLPSAALGTLLRNAMISEPMTGVVEIPNVAAYGVVTATLLIATALGALFFRWE